MQYGTSLLLSEDFANILSTKTRAKCRQVGRIYTQNIGIATVEVKSCRLCMESMLSLFMARDVNNTCMLVHKHL